MNTPAVQRTFFLLLLSGVTLAFCWLIAPFFGAVFWAVVLALVFQSLHQRVRLGLRRHDTLAALVVLLLIVLLVVVPLVLIGMAMASEAANLSQRLRSGEIDFRVYYQQIVHVLPGWLTDLARRFGVGNQQDVLNKITAALSESGQELATRALTIGQNTLLLIVNLCIMLYLLFFFLRDGPQLAQVIRRSMPMRRDHTDFLLRKFTTVVRATVKGTVVVALVQGLLGGLAFFTLGIHGAVLWGVVMAFLSLVPAVGASLVWAPVAIYLLATGSVPSGIGLAAWGAGVMGMVDNVLRPILVGKETKLPDYVVLLSTVGGISMLGINGFVIGPVIAALFVAAWSLFQREEQQRLEQPPPH